MSQCATPDEQTVDLLLSKEDRPLGHTPIKRNLGDEEENEVSYFTFSKINDTRDMYNSCEF